MAEDFTRYANDPVGFVTDVLGGAGRPYSKQAEMLEALVDHRRVSVVGANGSGKDWAAARAVLWWEETRPDGKAIVMGPTQRQVDEIVWQEMRQAYAAAADVLSGEMLKSAYRIDERRFALGFSTNNALNIQGFHSDQLLVVVTEAHAMPQLHMDAIKRLQPHRMLLTGNALSRDGEFYESHHAKRGLYHRMAISALDTPNFTGEDGGRPGMITPEYVEEYALDYGRDHPLFAASVLAQFPDALDDSLIGRDAVESAMARGEEGEGGEVAGRDAGAGFKPAPTRDEVAACAGMTGEGVCHPERSATEPRDLSGEASGEGRRSPRDVSASLNMTSEGAPVVPAGRDVGAGFKPAPTPGEIPACAGTTGNGDCHPERSETEPRDLSGEAPAEGRRSPRDVSASLNMTSEGASVVPAEGDVGAGFKPAPARDEVPACAGTTGDGVCHPERSATEPRDLSGEAPAGDGRSLRDVSASLNMTGRDGPVYIGVDVGRFGFDKSAICVRQGERVLSVQSFERIDTMHLVYEVLAAVADTGATAVFVDEGGVGGGVVDRLRELGAPVYGVHFGGASRQPTRFINRRSEIFWELRRLLHGELITLPRDEELAGQLLGLRYDVSSSGQVRLESKQTMRKRGMPSPDKADALALAFMTPPSFGIWTGTEPLPRDDDPPPAPTIVALGYDPPPPVSFALW